MRHQAREPDIREALIHALGNDENPGVRLAALKALESQANNAQVRDALREALLHDGNPGCGWLPSSR